MIWAGVIAQLNRTRVNRRLAATQLPYPLFVLLRHFAHDPARAWTINQLSDAFQTAQPGMSKRISKLVALGLLDMRPDEMDGRKKWFSLNAKGLALLEARSAEIRELDRSAFDGWSSADIDQLHASLYRLKSHLDDNR
ncbi:MAG: MarR family winged helix-turn-helix transcriptional regulator [Pseudomonadota bacterium]